MSDLISRSALIKELKDLADKNYDDKQSYFALIGAIGRVQDAPIAYDIEKVVAELEERRSEYEIHSQNAPDDISNAYRKGVMRGYEYSQDIVRKGGVNE